MSEKKVISYHTFVFPFLFDTSGKSDRKKFLDFLPALGKGLRQDTVNWEAPSKTLFDQYRYFTPAIRNALYTRHFSEDEIVWNYRYDLEYMFTGEQDGKWIQSKKGGDNSVSFFIKRDDFQATLAVNGVRLKLFNTGIGMLIFELENYELAYEKDIKSINEYGRRIYMPYIMNDDERVCHLCAENISLLYNGNQIDKASGPIRCMDSSRANKIELAPFIKYFLSNDKKMVTASPSPSKNEYYIEPIIDDRMFVACIYANDSFVSNMSQWDEERGTYAYLAHAEAKAPADQNNGAKALYEMMFIDADESTCQSRMMLKKMLEDHVYDRWLEYGTITGITEYSMITVTTEGGIQFLANPFLTEYVEMIYLVLAQRATFLAFERTVSNVACSGYKYNINKIQRQYVMFQSQLLLQEATVQQQGIELYTMLRKCLHIREQQECVDGQIRALYEMSTSGNEKFENGILFILATLGVFDCVDVVFGGWLEWETGLFGWFPIAGIGLLLFCNFFGKKTLNLFKKMFLHKK